jgi:hypoxanthine-DNA glycosylase
MPGIASLQAGQYYAHPRNAFWPILAALLGWPGSLAYAERLARLRTARIALWDVLQSCRREGSLDAAIDEGSIVPNDFGGFLLRHARITHVFFNGSKAESAFRRYVVPDLSCANPLVCERLPSTSPAHAARGFDEKLHAWRRVIQDPLIDSSNGV